MRGLTAAAADERPEAMSLVRNSRGRSSRLSGIPLGRFTRGRMQHETNDGED
jgi:hypothetical protein